MSLEFDAHELKSLSVDLPKLGRAGAKVMHEVITEGGDQLRDMWKRNAKATAGKHGRLYPESIEANLKISTDIVVEVGPNPAKPQGGMSFEYGSSKQPPHLDGQLAADEIVPAIQGRIQTKLFHMFGLDS